MPKGVYPHSKEHNRNVSLARLGMKFSEETRKNMSAAHLGKKLPEETRRRMSIGKLGNKNSVGRKLSEEHKQKILLAITGENSRSWKGDNVGNVGLHEWVRSRLKQPELCEFCNTNKSRHLANMTGIYNREFHNWKYLCVKCHSHYDRSRRLTTKY